MHKFFLVFGVLVLVGAGCLQQPPEEPADAPGTETEDIGDAMMEDGDKMDGEDSMMMEDDDHSDDDHGHDHDDDDHDHMMEDDKMDGDEDKMMEEEGGDVSISMATGNFFFEPNVINAKVGDTVTLTWEDNDGFHTFDLDELNVHSPKIETGESFSFTADKAGTFEFYCGVGQHRAQGMVGTITISE